VLALIGALTPALRGRPVLAIPAGLAAPTLWLAWLNQDGPGMICETTATTEHCSEQWSPWPFVVVAAVLVAISVAVAVQTRD
jgi:hypothetical protein